jgi:GDP-4-dehydro-6-deoxy-D-mannose reductase
MVNAKKWNAMNKKILIFGATGFVGKSFLEHVSHLPDLGFDITSVVRRSGRSLSGYSANLEIVESFDYSSIKSVIDKLKPDYIVNFIGLFGNKNFEDLLEANVKIPERILQAVLNSGLSRTRLLFIGSAAEYGSGLDSPLTEDSPLAPTTLYGLSKAFQTNMVQFYHRNYQINGIIARTFNLLGEMISAELSIGNFQRQISLAKNGDIIKTGILDSKRDFLHVSDAIDLYIKILLYGEPGQVYNVCAGEAIKVRDVLESLIAQSGKDIKHQISQDLLKENDILEIYGSRLKLDNLIAKN